MPKKYLPQEVETCKIILPFGKRDLVMTLKNEDQLWRNQYELLQLQSGRLQCHKSLLISWNVAMPTLQHGASPKSLIC